MTLPNRSLLFLIVSLFPFFAHAEYQFAGRHFLASYLECDGNALSDVHTLKEAMTAAVLASGATLLNQSEYIFEPDGLTMVFLLSESHASIHTYPEHRACFVDLFTCGDHCDAQRFHAALSLYLQPQTTHIRLLARNEEIAELPLEGYDTPHL